MRLDSSHWLLNKPIAHRGLWNEEIPENSLLAYENAIRHGFPIEIDVHKSKDGVLFVFHDDNLKRMTGDDALLHQRTSAEIKSLFLLGTEQKIPTLKEVLECVDGKVPLLIEIKNQPDASVVDDTIAMLKEYNGEFAIQSFNPTYIIKCKRLAPHFIRGVLGTGSEGNLSAFKRFIVKNLSLNFIAKPDFISYDYRNLPLKKKTRLPIICWTITSSEDEKWARKYALNVIFEKFIPQK